MTRDNFPGLVKDAGFVVTYREGYVLRTVGYRNSEDAWTAFMTVGANPAYQNVSVSRRVLPKSYVDRGFAYDRPKKYVGGDDAADAVHR